MMKLIIPTVRNNRLLLLEVFSLVGGSWEQVDTYNLDGKIHPPHWRSCQSNSNYNWRGVDPLVTIDIDGIVIASYDFDSGNGLVPTKERRTVIRYYPEDVDFLESACNLNHAIAYSFRNYFTSVERSKEYEDNMIEYTTVPFVKSESM